MNLGLDDSSASPTFDVRTIVLLPFVKSRRVEYFLLLLHDYSRHHVLPPSASVHKAIPIDASPASLPGRMHFTAVWGIRISRFVAFASKWWCRSRAAEPPFCALGGPSKSAVSSGRTESDHALVQNQCLAWIRIRPPPDAVEWLPVPRAGALRLSPPGMQPVERLRLIHWDRCGNGNWQVLLP